MILYTADHEVVKYVDRYDGYEELIFFIVKTEVGDFAIWPNGQWIESLHVETIYYSPCRSSALELLLITGVQKHQVADYCHNNLDRRI